MNAIDLYFQTTNRAEFLADLLALHLAQEVPMPVAGSPQLYPVEGVDLDCVGPLVNTPAVFDHSVFPPVVTTPATFYPGERANLRLTGPLAESRAAAIAAASMAHSTLLAPADVPPSQMRWSGGGEPWTGQASVPPPPPSAAPESLPATKTRLLSRLAHRRWQVETGGITINGTPVLTDRESTAMLGGALSYMALAPEGTTVPWKTATGVFVQLNLASMQGVALAVGQHVQACFAHEALLASQITAAPDATTLQPLALQVEAFTPVP